jgi:hypothetical protein
MASGGSAGLMNIVYIVILIWVLWEIGLPLAKDIMGEAKNALSLRAKSYGSVSYI